MIKHHETNLRPFEGGGVTFKSRLEGEALKLPSVLALYTVTEGNRA